MHRGIDGKHDTEQCQADDQHQGGVKALLQGDGDAGRGDGQQHAPKTCGATVRTMGMVRTA